MTGETLLRLALQSKAELASGSDVLMSFGDIDSKIKFDRAAERLVMAFVLNRFRIKPANRFN